MKESNFWEHIGTFAEFAYGPCNECVVEKYLVENPKYLPLCKKSCKEAIYDVYKQVKEKEMEKIK